MDVGIRFKSVDNGGDTYEVQNLLITGTFLYARLNEVESGGLQ